MDCDHTGSLEIYSDKGQILINPIKFEPQSNLNKSFVDSFQYAIIFIRFSSVNGL